MKQQRLSKESEHSVGEGVSGSLNGSPNECKVVCVLQKQNRARAASRTRHPMTIGSSPPVPTPLSVLDGPAAEATVT